MNIISSDVEVNEYKLIGTKSDELVHALKQLGLPYFFGFIRQLLLRDKLRSKTLDKEMILYLTVNKEQLDCLNFKKFKDSLLGLKEITEERENTEDELKIWKLIKIERKKLEEFRIEKEEGLEWELLKARIRFFEDLSKQEVGTIKVAIKNKEEIKEFSKKHKK